MIIGTADLLIPWLKLVKKESQTNHKYFSLSINLRNSLFVRIADFSLGIEFIFKAVIGQYNLRTIFLHSHWRKQCTDIQREKEKEWIMD